MQRWWRGGTTAKPPKLLDFGAWPLTDIPSVEVRLEPDLSRPPHVGFKNVNGRVEVESADGASSVEWTIIHKTASTRFELEMIEDLSREVVKPLGKTKLSRRQLKWSSIFKDDAVRERVDELNPTGDLEGYLFRVRLKVFDGPRWIEQLESEPFVIDVLPRPAAETRGAAASAYHALYEFHTSRAPEPRVVPQTGAPGDLVASVRLAGIDGKEKEARLDVSPSMLLVERELFNKPERLTGFRWSINERRNPVLESLGHAHLHLVTTEVTSRFVLARQRFFEAAKAAGSIEAVDLREGRARDAALEYVESYGRLTQSYVEHARLHGAVANADRQDLARLISVDTLLVTVPDAAGSETFRVLLVPPTHPASVAWLLGFQDLIHSWTRGRFDPDLKPPYRPSRTAPAILGGVEGFAVGPRTMVLATPSDGPTPDSWGFAGNLTRMWQCFIPVGADLDMRARDWASALVSYVGLDPRPIGGGSLDARRIGSRIKKYAVLHPYASRLRLAAVVPGDGAGLLEALREVDDPAGTPRGAQSVRDVRYELTLIGPDAEGFGRAVDELTLNPGDDRWARYATAVLDNPESVLVPGFSYAKRAIPVGGGIHEAWRATADQLAWFGTEGLHVTVIGPMLATSVGVAPRNDGTDSFRLGGLAARPIVRGVRPLASDPFAGNWLLSLAFAGEADDIPVTAARSLSDAVDVAHGVTDKQNQVGLEVALSGAVSRGLRVAHDTSDWVILSDPLFSIELLDRSRHDGGDPILLDFTPEFDAYPGGRVVVSTRYLREVEAIGNAVASALSSTGIWTRVLDSISARLLLSLANPTKQVVHGLAGLALSRVHVDLQHPGALVVPVDGHEDMFVFPRGGRGNILADLLAVWFDGEDLILEVVESKWTTKANLATQVGHGVEQATTTSEALREAYLEYAGVDRGARLDSLREVLTFHMARAERHGLPTLFSALEKQRLLNGDLWSTARVEANVLVWCPDGSFGTNASEIVDGVTVNYFDDEAIKLADAAMQSWPVRPSTSRLPAGQPSTAIAEIIDESVDDQTRESAAGSFEPQTPAVGGGDESPESRAQSGEDRSSSECIRLGTLALGRVEALWCPPRLSNGHLIIIGGSGAGKTTALRHIAGEIESRRIPVLVIDFHGDIELPAGEVSSYEFDYSGNLNFINPFHLDGTLGAKLTPTRLKWEFLEAWKSVYPTMGVHQTNFLASLIEAAFDRAGITDDPATWLHGISFGDVLDLFDESDAPESQRAKIESYMKRFVGGHE